MISCIVAVSENGVIGHSEEIPWYLASDFKYFKKTTMGAPMIMGRTCFESIGRPLPGRTNIIITRNPYYVVSGAIVVHSIEEALDVAYAENKPEVFIIGGGNIYAQTVDLWDRVYYTEVHMVVAGDTFFEPLDETQFELVSETFHPQGEKDDAACTFKIYDRIKN